MVNAARILTGFRRTGANGLGVHDPPVRTVVGGEETI